MSDAAYYVPTTGPAGTTDSAVHTEWFRPTDRTISTWGTTLQHGAPPSALLARALDRCGARPNTRLTRITIDLLGPVPITDIEVRSWIERPGRKIELVVAELWAAGPDGTGRAVARGSAWRLETVDLPAVANAADEPLPPVSQAAPAEPEGYFWHTGYVETLEWRLLTPLGRPGPASAWLRTDTALVEGETPTGLEKMFSVADVANGVGSKLHPGKWLFLNTELTVHLFRAPTGDWTGIRAETSYGPDGVGMTAGSLYDEHGAVGRIHQNVQVRAR
ncbi:thioesterase family protein [Rhodococcus zopfii]|uniref:thioesterase family protein n=1 Tax=Rhodococcus zopfii TaxID=43772 RepID=UPI001110FDA5|nr:thioesterase family protein [Rhodococcus zopfii]